VKGLSFAGDQAGSVPKGWEIAETNGKGNPAKWEVIADPSAPGGPNAVAITANENGGGTFNLLIAKETRFKDLDLSVSVKAVEGKEDQGGGPIWRAKDANNYSIARWNPLETNLRLYFVKDGKRQQLATVEKIETDPKGWHKIEVSNVGNQIVVKFDGKKLIEAEDATFPDAGRIGLWVKADGRSEFADVVARPARALVLHPKALLMDEPLSNLDTELNLGLREEILRLHKKVGFTLLYVTHDRDEAFDIGTRVVVMSRGRIARTGSVGEIRQYFEGLSRSVSVAKQGVEGRNDS